MNRRDQYRQYLKSDEWKENRDFSLERTSGFCQFCGDIANQVHHTKYPKQFGYEHPNSLIPVCKRCHDISHGVQKMKQLEDASIMSDLSPNGIKIKYLLSGGRVYASSRSWIKALQIPEVMISWFEAGLTRTAIMKKEQVGGELEMTYMNTPVYRWHAVADLLRSFDRQWSNDKYINRPRSEREAIKVFHENYEKLVTWGYDLQERALNSVLNPTASSNEPVTQDNLIEALKEAVAPRLREHDGKLHEHDVVISEIRESIPVLRDPEEFITIKQAISEQGFDSNSMPLYPNSKENLSGLIGQILKTKNVEKGPSEIARLDGRSVEMELNTYRRKVIYEQLKEISENKQINLL